MIPGIPLGDALRLGAGSENLYQLFNQFAKPDMKDDEKKIHLQSIITHAMSLRSSIKPLLDSWHNRLDNITSSEAIRVKSITRTVVGTGLPSLYEVGLSLHPQLGVPYIPASSIRGAVRAFFTSRQVFGDDKSELNRLFGNEPEETNNKLLQKGLITFMDMMPVSLPDLELDLINPHFPDYYKDNVPPRSNQNPIPIFFLTIAPGSEYVVRYRTNGDMGVELSRIIERTLIENGLGAKTALGYGRFKKV